MPVYPPTANVTSEYSSEGGYSPSISPHSTLKHETAQEKFLKRSEAKTAKETIDDTGLDRRS
jgi:hypothetical protein